MSSTRPWLFGIGWGKTGSNSLAVAVQKLGLQFEHLGAKYGGVFDPDNDIRHDIYRRYEAGDADPLAEFCAKLPAPVDGLIDWPLAHIWLRLFENDPETKFLVTYRNPHETALSFLRMAQSFSDLAIREQWHSDYGGHVRTIEEHYSQILHCAACQPERFLIVALNDDSAYKWRSLKMFLGDRAPNAEHIPDDTPWPHVFSHHEYYFVPPAEDPRDEDE